MAKIKLGALAQDVRGSLNGTTFSRNRGGSYVRTKVSPVQPVTEFNTFSRALFGAISQRWSTVLTDAQRAGWVSFAAVHPFINVFGDAIILSGVAFYQAVNRRLGEMGEDYIDDAPSDFSVEDPGEVTITAESTADAPSSFIVAPGRTLETNEQLYVFSTPPILGARTPQKNDYRLLNQPNGTAWVAASDNFQYVIDRFVDTSWPVGAISSVRVAIVNIVTGASSSPVVVPVEWVAP